MAYLCTYLDVANRLSAQGAFLRLDDDPTAFQQVQQMASNETLEYLLPLYNEVDLFTDAQNGGWVNDRATDLAAYYLACRRLNSVPKTATNIYNKCLEKLEKVQAELSQIPRLPLRHTPMPTFSNMVVQPWYFIRKARVENQISELSTPTGFAQAIDWSSAFFVEF